ncbi:MAG: chromosomal replication initiator protein DnaA [Verrucomicrobiota bacterium]|nr:chromosomal replication initiator protein DnaA [Limisphaera sp.]MDW8380888.1 chromosomal replication initiator protein DnaA [Verrucomicrobiota bacterium]
MQSSPDRIWAEAQRHLQTLLAPDLYRLWFAPIRAVTQANETLVLEVANEFWEVWLRENYQSVLEDAVALACGRRLNVRFQVTGETPETERSHVVAKPGSDPSAHGEVPRSGAVTAALTKAPQEQAFNPKYTFETFVVGSNNNFAHAAALAVAQAPGKAYNPLFLYGGVGLGKTHLLHAIGQYVTGQKPRARVAYVSCERFTNEFIDALQNSSLVQFRKRYRQTDVLLIDDVQFLAGKERIQEEFFHTFNALHEARKQIVLSCDRPASEIQGMEQRLVSRFEWGLVADLQPPDVEMRLAILRKKAELMNAHLPDEIYEFLAKRIRSNIRRLEGALIRVVSFASLTGKPLSIETVEGLLREILHEEGRSMVTIEAIQKKVAEHFDIRLSDMTSRRRPESIAFPRQIAMFLARRLTDHSLSAIGEAFGGRDHGTVLHACRLVKDRMDVDPRVRQTVHMLEQQLLR